MATINRTEDIQAWQKARELTRLIYVLTRTPGFKKDRVLVDQITRSSVSIMSNIAEGFARRTDRQFANFLSIAHGSVAELQTQLYIAFDQSYISEEHFKKAYDLSEQVSKLVQGFANYLKR